MTRLVALLVFVAAVGLLSPTGMRGEQPTTGSTKLVTWETELGRLNPEDMITRIMLSHDRMHAAWVEWGLVPERSGMPETKLGAGSQLYGQYYRVVVDGVPGSWYEDIGDYRTRLGRDGVSQSSLGVTLSLDGKRVGYCAVRGLKPHVVVDGLEGKGYDWILPWSLVFSPNSKRVAYEARQGQGLRSLVIVDGVEHGPYEDVRLDVRHLGLKAIGGFSPNSNRVAYVAKREGKWVVVVDGGDGLVFSPDSRRVAYEAERAGKQFVVVDGVEGKGYEYVGDVRFGPDSKRVAYTASRDGKLVVVVDGVESDEYDKIMRPESSPTPIFFSPDGRHVAYRVERRGRSVVVVDGVEGKESDSDVFEVVFSPDGQRVAYRERRDGTSLVVCDSIDGKAYDWVEIPRFSSDSKRMGYAARRRGKRFAGASWFVVIDGLQGKEYHRVQEPVFSPDGSRVAYGAVDDNGWLLVVDGVEYRGGYSYIHDIAFSPDSRHFAYLAEREHLMVPVVDGVEGMTYDVFPGLNWLVFDEPGALHMLAIRKWRLIRAQVSIRTGGQ